MEVRLYRPPTLEEPYFMPMGVTYKVPYVKYRESFYSYGDFEIKMSAKAYGAEKYDKYLFVLINKVFWGIILEKERYLDRGGDSIKIWGLSLDGLVLGRMTVPPGFSYEEVGGVAGYDVIDGTTETCIKHYAQRCWQDTLSPTRHIPGFDIAPDAGRGLPDDKYMTRFEELDKVIEDLGQFAKLGYKITPDILHDRIIFDCVEGTDRSATQSDNPRIIFAPERGNIESLQYLNSDRHMRNLFYASLSGGQFVDDVYTATVTRTPELPSGLYRWEQHMDISASHPEPGRELDELQRLALARAESYETVETFTGVVIDKPAQAYGVDYFLGDTVTIQNKAWELAVNAQIIEMTAEGSGESVTRSAAFNNRPIDVFDRIQRQIRGG